MEPERCGNGDGEAEPPESGDAVPVQWPEEPSEELLRLLERLLRARRANNTGGVLLLCTSAPTPGISGGVEPREAVSAMIGVKAWWRNIASFEFRSARLPRRRKRVGVGADC